MRYDFRLLEKAEAPKIEKLFQTLYKRPQGIAYWEWMFETPYGYIPFGVFDKDKLIGFYSAIMREDCATAYSAMVHPDYRKQGLFQYLAISVYHECEKRGANYVYLFDNENIHHIHVKYCGMVEGRQIKEYRIPYDRKLVNQLHEYYPIYHSDFERWRYNVHPHHQEPFTRYMYFSTLDGKDQMAFSTFENRVQILDFTDLEAAIGMGMFIVFSLQKEVLSFWCEQELDYPYVLLPTYRMYKLIGKGMHINKVRKRKLRMYQSDVF